MLLSFSLYQQDSRLRAILFTINFKMPPKKQNQKRSDDRRLGRQWDLICKRAENWFKDSNPSVAIMMLQGNQVVFKAPQHMQEFCKNAEVVRIFKDAALQRSLPFVHSASTGQKEETLPNQLELPYDDPASYTWDILVFIVPQILRCLGIKGKSCYTDVNKPTWWPDGLRFCSPNSGKSCYTDVNKPTWWPDGLRFCSPNSDLEARTLKKTQRWRERQTAI
uniref:Uncharacterized protein LOC111131661 isoform X2 n=1 Tax=Crassostrea virginica TaxID=6565 RepID=A0A8B8E6F5_CRAVI|nr:uncharacterized protein LOC111131661 isoform X2 [Crassostrea virginica]